MKRIPITDSTTLRLFLLNEINTKEFIELLLHAKETIIEKGLGLRFLVADTEIIFYFTDKFQDDDVQMDSINDIFYYSSCFYGKELSEDFRGVEASIKFNNKSVELVFEEDDKETIIPIEDIKSIRRTLNKNVLVA